MAYAASTVRERDRLQYAKKSGTDAGPLLNQAVVRCLYAESSSDIGCRASVTRSYAVSDAETGCSMHSPVRYYCQRAEVTLKILVCAPSAMSGTDLAYGTRSYAMPGTDLAYGTLPGTDRAAMRCPDAMEAVGRACELGYYDHPIFLLLPPCLPPSLTPSLTLVALRPSLHRPIALRAHYAMSGTDIAYQAGLRNRFLLGNSRSVFCYALPSMFFVLMYAMLLPGTIAGLAVPRGKHVVPAVTPPGTESLRAGTNLYD
eukprot:3426852-Rhodomonas_salina.8